MAWLGPQAPGYGQSYPTRPVRVIVPFQPGGSTDIFARLAAQKLTERFGKQFYIENIAGATGNDPRPALRAGRDAVATAAASTRLHAPRGVRSPIDIASPW